MTTILVTVGEGDGRRQLGNPEALVRKVLGDSGKIIYEYNLPRYARYIQERVAQGLVIPRGHGDYNTLQNMESYLGELNIPVLEAFRSLNAKKDFENWLKRNFEGGRE